MELCFHMQCIYMLVQADNDRQKHVGKEQRALGQIGAWAQFWTHNIHHIRSEGRLIWRRGGAIGQDVRSSKPGVLGSIITEDELLTTINRKGCMTIDLTVILPSDICPQFSKRRMGRRYLPLSRMTPCKPKGFWFERPKAKHAFPFREVLTLRCENLARQGF